MHFSAHPGVAISSPSSANAPVDDPYVTTDARQAHTPRVKSSDLYRRLMAAASGNNVEEVMQCSREGADTEVETEDGEIDYFGWNG
ncbi:hypothetical protein N7486_007058 [Penicillium sp. IBT 16267x]|nr:hypothetical protein N7486_007058 [Penicillium sp. IBT 16267x]